MSLSQLEHLPNELFSCIFNYLNGVDVYLAFSNLNERFNQLLDDVTTHKSFDLSSPSVSYHSYQAFINDQHGVRSTFISALKFDCFTLLPFDIEDLLPCFTNRFFNQLQRLTIVTLLEELMFANAEGRGRLEYLVIKFKYCGDFYENITVGIIERSISFDTMILSIHRYIPSPQITKYLDSPTTTRRLCRLNDTSGMLEYNVRLSLVLRYCSDFIVLFQCGALSSVQDLAIVFHKQNINFDRRQFRLKIDPYCLMTIDTSRLCSLTLCNIQMKNLLKYIQFLHLDNLDTLCLFNVVDNTFKRLNKFEQIITLRFSLCFSIDQDESNVPYSAKDYEILQNDLWKLRGWSVYHHWDTENEN